MFQTTILWLLRSIACSNGEVEVDQTHGADAEASELQLELSAPVPGAFQPEEILEVSGNWAGGPGASLKVNRNVVSEPGTWTSSVSRTEIDWPDSPLWPVLAHAEDDTTWLRARATPFFGESIPAEQPVEQALVARVTDHALVAVEQTLQQDVDVHSMLVTGSPIVSRAGVDVTVQDYQQGGQQAGLDFTSAGLEYSFALYSVDMDLWVDAGWAGTNAVQVLADSVTVSGLLVASVDEEGRIILTPKDTQVETENLKVEGYNDSLGLVDLLLGGALAEELEAEILEQAEALLAQQEEFRDLEFEGVKLSLRFQEVHHDEDGMNAVAQTTVALGDGGSIGDRLLGPSEWSLPGGKESPDGVPYQTALYIDDDLLSALGTAMVETRLLDQEISGEVGSFNLDTTLLGALLPGFDTLPAGQPVVVRTHPSVPLVGAPGDQNYPAQLHLGGLWLDFYADEDGDGVPDLVMRAQADVVIGVGARDDGSGLEGEILQERSVLMWTSLGGHPDEIEPGLETILRVAGPSLAESLESEFPELAWEGGALNIVDSASDADRSAFFADIRWAE